MSSRSPVGFAMKRRIGLVPAVILASAAILAGCGRQAIRPGEPFLLAYGGEPQSLRIYDIGLVLRGQITLGGMPQLVVLNVKGKLKERVEGPWSGTGANGGDAVGKRPASLAAGAGGTSARPASLAATADGFGARIVRLSVDLSRPEINGAAMDVAGMPMVTEALFLRGPTGELLPAPDAPEPGELWGWIAPFLGGIFPLLSPEPVQEGGKWEKTHSLSPGAGKLDITLTGSVANVERALGGARIVWLSTSGVISIPEPVKKTGLDQFSLTYDGTMKFAADEGRMIESFQSGDVRMKGRSGKSPVEARAKYTLTVKPAEK